MSDPVRVERNGPVTTVILNRPEARNAVNGPTATALYTAVGTPRSSTTHPLQHPNRSSSSGRGTSAIGSCRQRTRSAELVCPQQVAW